MWEGCGGSVHGIDARAVVVDGELVLVLGTVGAVVLDLRCSGDTIRCCVRWAGQLLADEEGGGGEGVDWKDGEGGGGVEV